MPEKDSQPQDIKALIRGAYDSMTTGQQRVAEFILMRGTEAVYLPATRIAEIVNVSHSTVIRMAQALGFGGFPELQAALQENFLRQVSVVEQFQFSSEQLMEELSRQKENDTSSVLHQVMQANASHIENVARQISIADFEHAVEMIDSARRVYVVGLRASAGLALNFGLGLRHIRSDCFILQPSFGDLPDQMLGISEDDLLVSISSGRYTRDTLHCMDYAREVGAQNLTITDSPVSPAAKRADVALVVPIRMWFYVMLVVPLSLLGALLIAVAMRHESNTHTRLSHLDEMFKKFQIFEGEKAEDSLSQIEPDHQ